MPPQQPWQKAIIALSAVVIGAVLTSAMYVARSIFIPIALAVFISFVLSPVVSRLQKYRLPRLLAVVVTVAVAVTAFTVVAGVVGMQIGRLASELPNQKQKVTDRLTDLRHRLLGDGNGQFGAFVKEMEQVIDPETKKTGESAQRVVLEPQGTSFLNRMDTYLSPAAELVGQAAFTFVLAVFMLLKREDMRNRFLRLVGGDRVTVATKAVDDASRRVSRFLLAQLCLNAAFGVVVVVALWLIGIQYVILWGALAFLMRYVPYVGSWIAVVPPTLFALATAEAGWQVAAVPAVFIALDLISANVFEPKLFGQRMGVSEVAQLVTTGFWAFLWGPIGLVLSQPLTTCVLVLGKYVPALSFLDVLLGDQPAWEPRVAFYQRLAARDQDEATALAEAEVAKGRSVGEVFDDLFVPALSTARTDLENGELTHDEVTHVLRVMHEAAEETADAAGLKLTVPVEPFDGPRVRVLGCPARDAVDHAAVEMFGMTLDRTRWEYQTTAVATLTSETMTKIEQFDPTVVVLASVPPGGVAHTKYMCKRLRAKFPGIKIVVGRWGSGDGIAEARTQLLAAGADRIDESMATTRQELTGWLTVLAGRDTPPDGLPAVGTASATVTA